MMETEERSISYAELADQDYSLCPSSPDGTGPHVPGPATVHDQGMPDGYLTVACQECGQTTGVPMPDATDIDWG